MRLHLQQIQCQRHHAAVDVGVYLGEIRGVEGQFGALGVRAMGGVPVVQPLLALLRPHPVHGGLIARLQIKLKIRRLAERQQPFQVAGGQRVHMADHQRHRVVAPSHLDLRNASAQGQVTDQGAQLVQAVPYLRNQHLAPSQVGDKAVALLAEAHQRLAASLHVLDPETGLAPVAGDRPGQRVQPGVRGQAAKMLQLLRQHRLLAGDLTGRRQVLQAAAAADQSMGAGRLDPLRGRRQDLHRPALVELATHIGVLEQHLFAGQGVVDEGGLAVQAGDAATVVTEALDGGGHRRFRQSFLAASSGHGDSRIAECGPPEFPRRRDAAHCIESRARRQTSAAPFCQASRKARKWG